jgi:hypothetical protein
MKYVFGVSVCKSSEKMRRLVWREPNSEEEEVAVGCLKEVAAEELEKVVEAGRIRLVEEVEGLRCSLHFVPKGSEEPGIHIRLEVGSRSQW